MAPIARAGRHWLARFRQTSFHDYHDQAFRLWSLLFLAGAVALGWAILAISQQPLLLPMVIAAMCVSALAAHLPIRLPRATISVSLADLAVFGSLALFGLPAACLAAVADAVVACWKTSTRVSSRLISPAIAASSMVVAGGVFKLMEVGGSAIGIRPETTLMAALPAAALVNYLMSTGMFSFFVAVKRDLPFSPKEFVSTTAWIGAVQVSSAVIAGLGLLVAQIFGMLTLVVLTCVTSVIALLVRRTVIRNEEERLESEAQIAEARRDAELNYQRFMASFTHAAIGMAITRLDGTTLRVNQSVCQLLHKREAELVGQHLESLFEPEDLSPHRDALREIEYSRVAAVSMEVRLRSVTGRETWVSVHCSSFDDPADGGTCLIYQMHDITSRREAEGKLAHIAYHDSLTDVANRAWFDKELTEAVDACSHYAFVRFAVVMLDLDRFKIINDSLGHAAGNLLLVEVARRLKACVRPTDLVARLGGDEFALLLRSVTSIEEARRVSERVIEVLAEPMRIMSNEVVVRASLGVTLSDLGYRTADEMTRDADLAMYEAKSAGRGRVAVYDSSMHHHIADRMRLEADLAQAIQESKLTLVFQPLFQLRPYRLTGFEALCRWVHPERGPIPPSHFIQLAEESGLVASLTPWVIKTAVDQLASWRRMAPHLSHLSVNVNVSGRDLALQNFAPCVKQALAEAGLPPANLTLEITETSLMHRMDTALDVMQGLRDHGVHFAIDDFGTGYSSLSYLSSLPIDGLKIDRSFINGMDRGLHNVEIVRAVNRLGQALGKKVVAEGIETEEQLQQLRDMEIHTGQGYLLARPMLAENVPELLFSQAGVLGQQAA
jgi:diguanylate cyclase (GGDEF)-like protein/PAS domain S-box-containing protein